MSEPLAVWTIGHSNHPLPHFLDLLEKEEIRFLVDVRSFPYSRHAAQFNREELREALGQRAIGYLFLGEELGGRPSRGEDYDDEGRALYWRMARDPGFQCAVERLIAGAREHRIALLCSEADPQDCHRRLLIGKVLADRGIELRHILRDGGVRAETEVGVGSPHPTLFAEDLAQWRSTRSVSHRRRLNTSSAG
jgi:uncharacterized protein (DUF488 family)